MAARQATAERTFDLAKQRETSRWDWLHRLIGHRFAFLGLVLIGFFTAVALLAPILAPHDPTFINPVDRLQSPGSEYWLGSDYLGRDVVSRLVYGARISLGVGAVTVIICTVLGVAIGVVSGYYSRIDNVLMRIMDAFMAFPGILLALGIMAVLGPAVINTMIALSIVYTPRMARLVRSSVLVIREMDYVLAGRAIGMGDIRILFRHIVPNCMGPILVQATFIFAYAIIAEASLSFLGVGSSPEVPSWGNMLSEARQHMRVVPLLSILPGVAIMLTVLSLNLLGDGLRDILDPYTKDQRGADA
jgi:peptide/nickel transport system permease protein